MIYKKCLLLVLLVVLLPVAAWAQSGPFVGAVPAEVTLAGPATVTPGSSFTVDVNVDLSGIVGTCGVNVAPAVLAGYTIPVSFQPANVQFVSAAACTSPQYATAPLSTAVATANANGIVTINASQASESAPTGNVCVARLTFAVQPGAVTSLLTPTSPNLSSAFQNCAGGGTSVPATIPSIGVAYTAAIVGPPPPPGVEAIPFLSPLALLFLVMVLGAVGMVAMGAFK